MTQTVRLYLMRAGLSGLGRELHKVEGAGATYDAEAFAPGAGTCCIGELDFDVVVIFFTFACEDSAGILP
jgi:hypothetical protein